MSALSSAMDTLATLTSVLAPTRGNQEHLDLSGFEIKLDGNAERAFSEFSTGMKMLYKHGIHNACDISAITRQNVKLLHTNLKTSKSYRSTIALIRSNASVQPHWYWLPLLETSDLNAGLLYLAPGNSIAPNQGGVNITIRESDLHAPFSLYDDQSANVASSYLNVFGKTRISLREPATGTLQNSVMLKSGDAYAEDVNRYTVDRLITEKDPSLLLSIRMLQR